jgi:hypothetical protein
MQWLYFDASALIKRSSTIKSDNCQKMSLLKLGEKP